MGIRILHQLPSLAIHCAIVGATWGALLSEGTSIAWARPPSASGAAATSQAGSDSSVARGTDSGVAAIAPNSPAEKRAAKLASEAIGTDYWSGHHPLAEKKLREAIQICMVQNCSVPFVARLHRDLGVVYIAGMKRVEDGKDEFTAALAADATVALAAPMDMPAVKQAFADVKASMPATVGSTASAAATGVPAPAPETKPEPEPQLADANGESGARNSRNGEPEPEEAPELASARRIMNWVTLGLQQDFVFHSQTPNACSPGSNYKCFDAAGTYVPVTGFAAGGNQVSSGGITTGTLRLLIGFDRVLGRRFTLGLRVGSVLAGKAEKVQGDRAFMYFHGEGRAAVWFARDPFIGTGIHPYLFGSTGVAEVDGKVLVEYTSTDPARPCPNCKLDAWKRSGNVFFGIGAGVQAAITPKSGPILEARYMQFVGPSVPVIGAQLGYAVGF